MSKGILITAYKQKDLTQKCIERFNSFNQKFKFVVVSTSEVDVGFKELESKFNNVHVIEFMDAPFWKQGQDNFPLVSRILLSIKKGLELFEKLGIKKVLHLHSDTYWKIEKQYNLYKLFDELSEYMIIADSDSSSESSSPIPKGIHLHPEGIFFNLLECKKYGYGFTFEKACSESPPFRSHNSRSIEAILGQYAIFCLSGKNILSKNDIVPDIYYKKVKINIERDYHGEFISGLVNVKTKQ